MPIISPQSHRWEKWYPTPSTDPSPLPENRSRAPSRRPRPPTPPKPLQSRAISHYPQSLPFLLRLTNLFKPLPNPPPKPSYPPSTHLYPLNFASPRYRHRHPVSTPFRSKHPFNDLPDPFTLNHTTYLYPHIVGTKSLTCSPPPNPLSGDPRTSSRPMVTF